MQNNPTTLEQPDAGVVGFTPDKMAAAIQAAVWKDELPEFYSKQDAADFLYRSGVPMSFIVENIDEAIAMERGAADPALGETA